MRPTSRAGSDAGAATGMTCAQRAAIESDIVFDGRYIQDRYHGIGRYAFHLVEELAERLPDSEIAVLRDTGVAQTRFDLGRLASRPNVNVQAVGAPVFSLREQLAVPSALYGHRPRLRLYHSPYFALPWLPAPARSIVTVHDCIFERDARYMPRRWGRLYYRLLALASTMRAGVVAVPSSSTARDVRRYYRVPERKIVITPEAADPSFRPVDDHAVLADVRRRHALPESFVLAVGARRPHKNFATLARAVERLDGAHLVFVGEADERFEDEAAVEARSLGERAHFLGKVSEEDLPAIYSLATVVACPSIIEGFGLPVLEAMACGTPVVCSSIQVFKEVAGNAALYAPPRDVAAWAGALRRALGSAETQAALGRAGLARAGSFSWAAAAEALMPAYISLQRK